MTNIDKTNYFTTIKRHSKKVKKQNKKILTEIVSPCAVVWRTLQGSFEECARSQSTLSFGLYDPPLLLETPEPASAPRTSGSTRAPWAGGPGRYGYRLHGHPGGGTPPPGCHGAACH